MENTRLLDDARAAIVRNQMLIDDIKQMVNQVKEIQQRAFIKLSESNIKNETHRDWRTYTM